jgi:hypothetical protein
MPFNSLPKIAAVCQLPKCYAACPARDHHSPESFVNLKQI